MPGVNRMSIDVLVKKAKEVRDLGIPAIALFPVIEDPSKKDAKGSESLNPNSLVCRTIRALKAEVPDLGVIADVALDPYTSHGQDGIVKDGKVDNDLTLENFRQQAVILAEAGADVIAPSDMMDGRVLIIREALEEAGYPDVQILAYSAKYVSSFYGPFRDAVDSKNNLGSGNKKTYQGDFSTSTDYLREVELDINEGADMIMIKPGLPYLDIIRTVKDNFNIPVLAYQVSGEYAMVKFAAEAGAIEGDKVMLESLIAFKRAGACAILTYAAEEVARMLRGAQ
jgi:porphobilinogen synthase